jgi:SAM-dependent methyltransferase
MTEHSTRRSSTDAYRREWFAAREPAARRSAETILPFVLQVVQPRSVVDVGCGLGSWLAVAHDLGVERILGIDGPYVDREALEIPSDRFFAHDLSSHLSIDESFDLALSLEVAEHLPSTNASQFVAGLVQLAPAVLFSAAVPFQGGTGHQNEQWPAYWARLFRQHDYVALDFIRQRFWSDEGTRYFYAQNTVLYVVGTNAADYRRRFLELDTRGKDLPLSLIHPHLYLNALRRFPTPEDATLTDFARFAARCLASPFRRGSASKRSAGMEREHV